MSTGPIVGSPLGGITGSPLQPRWGGTWTPQRLVRADASALWFDPSILTLMWQDRAGTTTPVTGANQPVGKMLDRSGKGYAATAPSDAARPLLRTDGRRWWLEYDAVDDFLLITPDVPFSVQICYAIGVEITTYGNANPIVFFVRGSDFAATHRQPMIHFVDGTPRRVALQLGTAKTISPNAGDANLARVFAGRLNADWTASAWQDGVALAGNPNTTALTSEGINNTGRLGNAGFGGRVYGVFYSAITHSDTDMLRLSRWQMTRTLA